ncbi:MAG: hypothetical protein IJ575_01365 [Selenomonadaceae bacterium]|nr:hypothetical protein [Selenomonadaceae bacterium]
MLKVIPILAILFSICQNCFAMNFSEFVKLGGTSYPPWGIEIKNATSNTETPKKVHDGVIYENGIAQFGNGDDSIYCHYSSPSAMESYFGDKDKSNAIKIEEELYGTSISQIKNDSDAKIYLLHSIGASSHSYICLGKKNDGTWVKYFDTREIAKKYFNAWAMVSDAILDNDTIIIGYSTRGTRENRSSQRGEFRFKWDDAAQWFSVEHVQF